MNSQFRCVVLIAAAIAAGFGMRDQIRAQAPESSSSSSGSSSSVRDLNGSKVEVLRRWKADGPTFQYSSNHSLLKAAEAVRNAKGDDEEAAARKKLAEVVEKCFDDDMAQRKKDLAQLEERLAKLREQLDRRKAKKQEIVDLQIKVLLNEADGLGFASGSSSGPDSLLRIGSPVYVPGAPGFVSPAPPRPAVPAVPAKPRSPEKAKAKASEDSKEEST